MYGLNKGLAHSFKELRLITPLDVMAEKCAEQQAGGRADVNGPQEDSKCLGAKVRLLAVTVNRTLLTLVSVRLTRGQILLGNWNCVRRVADDLGIHRQVV